MKIATTGTADHNGTFLVFHGPYRDILPRMASCGYRYAELHIDDSAGLDRAELGRLLRENGLSLTSIGTGSVYGRLGYNLVDREPAVRRKAIRHLEQHMLTAQPHGALVIVGCIAGRLSDCSGICEYRANLEESLGKLDALAGEHGVTLGFELMNRYESCFLTRIEDGVHYLRVHDFKHILLHIDTVHMNIEEADIGAAVRSGAGYIGHVHVADNDRWYPGHGHYPFRDTLQALKDIGYKGALALETNGLPSERVSAERSLEYLEDLLERLD